MGQAPSSSDGGAGNLYQHALGHFHQLLGCCQWPSHLFSRMATKKLDNQEIFCTEKRTTAVASCLERKYFCYSCGYSWQRTFKKKKQNINGTLIAVHVLRPSREENWDILTNDWGTPGSGRLSFSHPALGTVYASLPLTAIQAMVLLFIFLDTPHNLTLWNVFHCPSKARIGYTLTECDELSMYPINSMSMKPLKK